MKDSRCVPNEALYQDNEPSAKDQQWKVYNGDCIAIDKKGVISTETCDPKKEEQNWKFTPSYPKEGWQTRHGHSLSDLTEYDLVDAALLADAKKACAAPKQEPHCGVGAPGPIKDNQGCPRAQRQGCTSTGGAPSPQAKELWCNPGSEDPIVGGQQVLDDDGEGELKAGALCEHHCKNWKDYNKIKPAGDSTPRLPGCEASWNCQAWTWDPAGGELGTCYFKMFTQKQVGADSWDELLSPCDGCVSGFIDSPDETITTATMVVV